MVPVPDDKLELVDDNDELDAMDGDGEQPVDPELAFQHIIIIYNFKFFLLAILRPSIYCKVLCLEFMSCGFQCSRP